MFPIRDVAGSVIGFGGRVLPSSAARRRLQQIEGEAGSTSRTYFDPPKYINSPTTSGDALMSCLYLLMWLCLDMMVMRMRTTCMMIIIMMMRMRMMVVAVMMMIMRMMMVVRMMIMVMTMRLVFAVMVVRMIVAVMVIIIMMRRKRRLIMMIYYYSSLHVSIIHGVVFKKSDSLYGIDLAADGITKSDVAVIVEGYFDVISMHDMGISNVVAALGTAVTINQLMLAASFSKSRRVILLMDGDAAGIQALEQIKNRVEKHRLKDRSTDGILLLTTSIASIRGFIEAEKLIPRISSSSSSTASSSSSSSEDQLKVDYYDEIMTHLKDCSDVHMWFSRPDAFRIMQHVLCEATTLL